MGAEIAKCLTGPVQRRDGYLVTKDGIVTWAFGHILRQAEPEEYNAKYKNGMLMICRLFRRTGK